MLSKILSLDQLSYLQIWNIEKEKERKSRRDRPAKLNAKKEQQRARVGDKEHLLEEQHKNFVAAVNRKNDKS